MKLTVTKVNGITLNIVELEVVLFFLLFLTRVLGGQWCFLVGLESVNSVLCIVLASNLQRGTKRFFENAFNRLPVFSEANLGIRGHKSKI